ncbi:peptide-methionine (S)-S-oxide reductase MsrA [Amaricoccus sp.]|uniref:peptide-methionine (S)-S-oxide reductase MsrA n=1 Tax=Amaricoccus sp. TaxID=1872485 RepID=UPI001B43A720|nr:peptide-methionine (S)-S-oxide reductase MsrA [Amaricoccus sp.]MBP7001032.1 peptide-methionine (S)-S-oxide reductase MsrA [Amaricoccus sp.]
MRLIAWLAIVLFATLAGAGVVVAPATETAVLSAGCFWCVEADLSRQPGVLDVETGYAGGSLEDPTFRAVVSGTSGHVLAVRVTFDPAATTYDRLLVAYFLAMDPTDAGGQACERGRAYAATVFYVDGTQQAAAGRMKARATEVLGRPVTVALRPAGRFWKAEEQYQDYAVKNPLRYDYYRRACGRDARVREVWKGGGVAMAGGLPLPGEDATGRPQ